MTFDQTSQFAAQGRTAATALMNRLGNTFINVRDDYGAKGDGLTDDTATLQAALNAAFGTGTGTITQMAQRRVVIPPGKFIVRGNGLTGKNWFGGCVHGSGRFSTQIQNADGGPVITTDGCQYMRFGDMQLDGSNGTSILFNLDFKGTGTALQSNTFENMYFSDAGVGLMIAESGFMGSENLILNCFFGNLSSRGLQVVGFNALQQTIVGGNFQNCGIGVNVNTGSVNVINGVGFQDNGWDIQIDGARGNTMVVMGCRTESSNFINNLGTQAISVMGCHQTSSVRGLFYTGNGGMVDIGGCFFNGQILPKGWTRLTMRSCEPNMEMAPNDWLIRQPTNWWYIPNNPQALVIELENILSVTNSGAVDPPIGKQRIFTTDGQTVTTQNYVVA